MNRRGFFGALIGGITVAADPERLLWIPGKKLISIPSVSDYDGPYMLTPTVFARLKEWEAAHANGYVTIQNQRILTEAMHEELDPLPRKLKIGDTIRVRHPERFTALNVQVVDRRQRIKRL